MKPFRSSRPALRHFLPLAGVLLAAGAWAAPLQDSPYRRIMKSHPGGSPRFIRVEAVPKAHPESVVSPSEPEPEKVRQKACEGLEKTSFPCAKSKRETLQYVVRLTYHVQNMQPFGLGRRSEDPPQDSDHELVWRFTVMRQGEEKPLFRSVELKDRIQFWTFNVTYWMKRYFSE